MFNRNIKPTDTAPTCICTLQVSLRDSVAPPRTSVRLSKSRSSCIRGSAWPVVTHPLSVRTAAIEPTAHCAWHCFPSLLLVTRFVLNAPMALYGHSTTSCPTPLWLCVVRFGSLSVTLLGTGHQARASVVDLWTHGVCSDCVSLFPAAQV